MKKIFYLIVSIFFFLNAINVLPALAQQEKLSAENAEIARARQDYLFQFSRYNQAHGEYTKAKGAYAKFQTISSQQEAIAKTKEVLVARAEALHTYLQLIKVIIYDLQQLNPSLKNAQMGKIEATQSFLTNHQQNVENSQSISELNSESNRLEREAKAIENLSYESLAVILIGKIQGFGFRAQVLLEDLKNAPDFSQNPEYQRGIGEIENKLSSVRVNLDFANELLQQYQVNRKRAIEVYKSVQKETSEAKKLLSEAALLLKEMKGRLANE